MKVAIRVDASINMGTGHVMRCLTLADTLTGVGADVTFICREHYGHLAEIIKIRGYPVLLLGKPESKMLREDGDPVHSHWLGVSWQHDAEETVQKLASQKIDWLVVDHYGLDARWHKKLRQEVGQIMVIDDLADRSLDCDLLVDQNFYLDSETRYQKLVNADCRCLLGPDYAMLRPEFIQGINQQQFRIRAELKRIFVFMGGADATNETAKAIRAIDMVNECSFKVDIVVGSVNPYTDEIRQLCSERDYMMFHQDVRNIAELMNHADLAIGAGGATTLERCYLQLPSIVIVLAENQKQSIADLEKIGAVESAGWYENVQADNLAKRIANYCQYPEKLEMMSHCAAKVMNQQRYRGVHGIVNMMCL
ncbi:MAG: UDP-2,4-diacetamido-2,4,6-trideoxy-beta-L-altropyranose hydrolase [Gammaproteobacteria bacterium]|nr:UDP-2,4-diacetamido-2,4,6-trideoxy-beta-L-altropyranose hydrolase [Gammaproteobacteria bacterium]